MADTILTAEERAALFAGGAAQVTAPDGVTYYANGTAYRTTSATRVNTTTANEQYPSHIAMLAGGGHVVMWGSYDQDAANSWDVYMQRYDASGAAVGVETRVNTTTAGGQYPTTVLALADGGFMAIWNVSGPPGTSEYYQMGQRYLADGTASGGEVQIALTDYQLRDTFEALAGGGFIHVSRHQSPGGPSIELYGRIYAANGAPVGAEFMINPVTHDPQVLVSVASLSDGGFLVGFNSSEPGVGGLDSGSEIRRFDSSGALVGVVVPHAWPNNLRSVTEMANGRFVAVWQSTDIINPAFTAQVYTLAGTAVGQAFQIPSAVPPEITGLTDGGFVAVWHHNTGSGRGSIRTAHYDANGVLVGEVTTLVPPVGLTFPTVAATADGGYSVTWWAGEFGPADVYKISQLKLDYHMLTASTDTIVGGSGDTVVVLRPETLGAADSLSGGIGNDTLELSASGTLDLVTPAALSGFETVLGASGDDTFVVSEERLAGISKIDGRGGIDTLSFAKAAASGVWALASTPGQALQLVSIENLIGSAFNDSLTGDAADNVIEGGAGDDTINGAGGTDTASYAGASAAVSVNLSVAAAQSTGGAGVDTLTSIENLTGSAYDDALIGAAGVNTLAGGAGNDILDGGPGDDRLDGGAGSDTAAYLETTSGVTVSLALQGSAQATGGAGNDTLVSIENLTGSAFADTLTGDAGVNVMVGAGGNDTLDGGAGADRLYGGIGADTYFVDSQADLVFEFTSEGIDTVIAAGDFYLYANLENLTLSSGAGDIFGVGNGQFNKINGNQGANLLLGGGGNDILNGGAGNDRLFGEDGADQLNGDAGDDLLAGGANSDLLSGGDGADRLYGEDGNDSLRGEAGVDILVGGAGDDILFGGSAEAEQDLMDGGAGNDLYLVDANDLTFEAADGGIDTVLFDMEGSGYYLYANVENLTLGGTASYGVGNELDNQITGSDSANWLLGGAGNDTLDGGTGNDVLFGQSGSDTFVFNIFMGADRFVGADVIADFAVGVDKVRLLNAYGSFAEVQQHMVQNGTDTAIDFGHGNLIVFQHVAIGAFSAGDFLFGA